MFYDQHLQSIVTEMRNDRQAQNRDRGYWIKKRCYRSNKVNGFCDFFHFQMPDKWSDFNKWDLEIIVQFLN